MFSNVFGGFAITVSGVFFCPRLIAGRAGGLANTFVMQGFPLFQLCAVAVSASGHPGARVAFGRICLFSQRFSSFCDNRVSVFLPRPETLIFPRIFNDFEACFFAHDHRKRSVFPKLFSCYMWREWHGTPAPTRTGTACLRCLQYRTIPREKLQGACFPARFFHRLRFRSV